MDYTHKNLSLLSEQQSEKVEIYFHCFNLQIGSHPSLRVFVQETNKPQVQKLLTKTNSNIQNPDFPETLVLDYFFEVRQKIIAELLVDGKVVGIAETFVGEVFSARSKGVTKTISVGQMTMLCEKVEKGNNKSIEFTPSVKNLNVSTSWFCFGTKSALFRIYKIKKTGDEYLLYESQAREGGNNHYNSVRIGQRRLSIDNPDQKVIIRFYEGDSPLAETETCLRQLLNQKQQFPLMYKGKQKGVLRLQNLRQTVKHQFTDYLQAGMQMALVICIDFTGSNGIQSSPTSLHYTTANKRSQYQQALHQAANIVLDYDTDKLVPTFGFGAKVNMPTFSTNNKVHHCFPLNGSADNPNLFNIDGIMQGYRNCLKYLSFGGPTCFAPLLTEAMNVCRVMKQNVKQYMILLILTDGIIHDIEEVKDLLVKCGRLPLSIVIVGIGNNEDWSLMNQLDDDYCQMRDKQGNPIERDLVQFVQFSKHQNNGVQLAREVLQELPRQIQEYHKLVNLTPMSYSGMKENNILSEVPNLYANAGY